MIDRAQTHARPWPIDPREAPLDPARRVKGPPYSPPPVDPRSAPRWLVWGMCAAGALWCAFAGYAALVAWYSVAKALLR